MKFFLGQDRSGIRRRISLLKSFKWKEGALAYQNWESGCTFALVVVVSLTTGIVWGGSTTQPVTHEQLIRSLNEDRLGAFADCFR
jgi:hypothetical protein